MADQKELNTMKAAFKGILQAAAGQRRGFEDFMEWLEDTDFFEAPASTKYHGCEKGGLLKHSLNVYQRMMMRNDIEARDMMTTVPIVALLHDVCKIDTYLPAAQEDGEVTEWRYNKNKKLPIGHGERSVILIQQQNLTLTMEEIVAIRWHMGAYDDAFRGGCKELGDAFRAYPMALKLHLADMEATYLDESRKE